MDEVIEALWDRDTPLHIVRCHRHDAGPSWRIQHRVLPDQVVYLVLRGRLDLELGPADGPLRQSAAAGAAFWIGSGVPHAVHQADGPVQFFVLRFQLEASFQPGHCLLPQGMTALPLLDQLAACTMAGSARSAERQRAMLINLFALLRDVQADAQPAGLSIQRQAHLRQWLAEHFQHHPTAEDLARCIGLSLHYFRQQFHKSFACTPREWIRDERLRFAAELLLDSDESVADIAEHCGYRSVSSFSRLFSTCFGCGPKQWRQTADRSALVRVDRLTPQASAR